MGVTTIDRQGRILIQDEESTLLHAFDQFGDSLFIAKPAGGDFDGLESDRIDVDSQGNIYVRPDQFEPNLIQFTGDGKRVGRVAFETNDVAFAPDGSRWVASSEIYDEVSLKRVKDGEALATILRSPTNRWLMRLTDLQVDEQNRLLVQSYDRDDDPTHWLAVYSPDGNLQSWKAILDASGSKMAVCKKWVIFFSRWQDSVVLLRRADQKLFDVQLEGHTKDHAAHFGFSPQGHELWWIDSRGPTLRKFELP